jgi:hypothetical protein
MRGGKAHECLYCLEEKGCPFFRAFIASSGERSCALERLKIENGLMSHAIIMAWSAKTRYRYMG